MKKKLFMHLLIFARPLTWYGEQDFGKNSLNMVYKIDFNVILGMYKSVKSCISVNGKLSPLFECNMGMRQGENLSPILFALFLNDVESFMYNSALQGISLTEHNSQNNTIVYLKLLLLLYADDTVIFADKNQGLQKELENPEVYCKI